MTQYYLKGFSKVAEEHGLNPLALRKIAEYDADTLNKIRELKKEELGISKPKKKSQRNRNMTGELKGSIYGSLLRGLLASAAYNYGSVAAGERPSAIASLGIAGGYPLLEKAIAGIAAGLTPTRSQEEQDKHDSIRHSVKNWIVPGYADYNGFKRSGLIRAKLNKILSEAKPSTK